ncbi:hypothetical protein H6G00_16615 [Leptolyngbya sp. FACHB-541]|uniref:hypothetical protein n=1 Tax=Leptolyngbya sp. FACHB-541 TaxID=2692810 RepID=UPI001682F21D|nr:hypothetical protein [Leptolyngbya sp. FACHB-541]MBD1998231.1 hypothetical protein [Leptolyngbya sp. FACHB-541]
MSELMAIATTEPTHQAAKPGSQKTLRTKLNLLGTSHPLKKLCFVMPTEKFRLLPVSHNAPGYGEISGKKE